MIVSIDDESLVLKCDLFSNADIDIPDPSIIGDFAERFRQLKQSLGNDEIHRLSEQLSQETVIREESQIPLTTWDKAKEVFEIFVPKEGYFITPLLILLNVLVYVLMTVSGVHFFQPETGDILRWGGNFRPSTLGGEWWRLITSCFVHIGILHLVLNMYALLFIGAMLEPLLGKWRYLMVYLVCGLGGSLASLWWNEAVVSAGASGAIFGLYGLFLALLSTSLVAMEQRKEMLGSIGVFVVFNLFMGMKEGIDNAGHIGGLASGLAGGYLLYPVLKEPAKTSRKALVWLFPVLMIGVTAFGFTQISNASGDFRKALEQFEPLEEDALAVFNLPESQFAHGLRTTAIPNWKKSIGLFDAVEVWELSTELREQHNMVFQYCLLRKNESELLLKAYEQPDSSYEKQIEEIQQKIDQLLKTHETD